ncbi:hypothetical protein ACH4E9_09600 [Streptomyces anulatus]
MSMKPLAPERRSRALDAYLRHTWHTRPSAIAEAERQLREYSRNPPGRIRQELGEFYSIPDTGKPQSDIGDWLAVLADHLKRSAEPVVHHSKQRPPQTACPRTLRRNRRSEQCAWTAARSTSSPVGNMSSASRRT